jgi:hypothetical protein
MTENIKIIKLGSENGKNNPSQTNGIQSATSIQQPSSSLVPSISRLYSCYQLVYRPPLWVGQSEFQSAVWKYASHAKVYYPYGASFSEVKQLATQREPTNLGGDKLYDRERLLAEYGYAESPYKIGSPNIAIFCRTPVLTTRMISPDRVKYANILSAIAPALDTQEQPDYRYLASDPRQPKRNYKYACMMAAAFRHIRTCFIEDGYRRLVMTGLGMGNFKYYAEELDIDAEHIFRECLFRGLGDLFTPATGKEMWLNCTRAVVLREHIPAELRNQVILKALDIQTLLDNLKQTELDETLIINAWDPFSMVGNGNAGDISLDGYIGRISAIGVLSWPITNPQIQWQAD